MITIEKHLEIRTKLLDLIKETHQSLIAADLDFWKKSMKNIFSEFPELDTLSWGQGFLYNDENYAFRVHEFKINDLIVMYQDFYYEPRDSRTPELFKNELLFLMDKEQDEKKRDIAFGSRAINSKNKEYTMEVFRAEMLKKSEHLMAVTTAVVQLLNQTYYQFGERHFADTFGKKAKVIFNSQGLLIEDYDDYDAMDYGQLEDLVD